MIAIFGGSFDPVHNGHLIVAQKVLECFKPSQIRFLPCGQHAFSKPIQTSAVDRLEMLALALLDAPAEFCIDEAEIRNHRISYTIDTLRSMRSQLSNNEGLALIMGEDAFSSLDKWKEWESLLDYSHIIVVSRTTEYSLNAELAAYVDTHKTEDIQSIKNIPFGKIYFLEMPLLDISSTAIREQLALNKNPKETIPAKVLDYIQEKGLYT